MKKLLSVLILLVSAFSLVFGFSACGDYDDKYGEFYTLKEAYEKGWLNGEDLKSIACGYYELFQFDKYSEYENLYNGLFVSPEKLSAKKEKELKKAYLEKIGYSDFSVEGVHITQYYGSYNENIVIGFTCDYIKFDIITTEKYEIGGVIFYRFWEGSILVYNID